MEDNRVKEILTASLDTWDPTLEPMKVRITRDSNIGVRLNPKIIPNGVLMSIVFEESSHLQQELITSAFHASQRASVL